MDQPIRFEIAAPEFLGFVRVHKAKNLSFCSSVFSVNY